MVELKLTEPQARCVLLALDILLTEKMADETAHPQQSWGLIKRTYEKVSLATYS